MDNDVVVDLYSIVCLTTTFFFYRDSLCSSDCHQTCNSPDLAFLMLGLQACLPVYEYECVCERARAASTAILRSLP